MISPTLEGFRTAFRRPSLAFAEISWRWSVGATAIAIFFFGLLQFLGTLPVTKGELLFLRTRQPYLIGQALSHILRGSLRRAVAAGLLAALMLGLLWMFAAALGRLATLRSLLDHFRNVLNDSAADDSVGNHKNSAASDGPANFAALVGLNFLRIAVVIGVLCALAGSIIVAGFASPDSPIQPGLVFLLFLMLAALALFAGWVLNWFLSLAALFAVRDGKDAVGCISAAVAFCRDHARAVLAVSTWTGLAHLAAFVGATVAVSVPLGLAGALRWRVVVLAIAAVTLVYFAVADWLYMARLAGYVCITEMPEAIATRIPLPIPPPPPAPLQTTIDRDELILSDAPNPISG
jgi:hypothetical protein